MLSERSTLSFDRGGYTIMRRYQNVTGDTGYAEAIDRWWRGDLGLRLDSPVDAALPDVLLGPLIGSKFNSGKKTRPRESMEVPILL